MIKRYVFELEDSVSVTVPSVNMQDAIDKFVLHFGECLFRSVVCIFLK